METPQATAPEDTPLAYLPAPPVPDEDARQAALENYQILETEAEQAYDDLTALAAAICGTPVAAISLIDSHRQWFKSRFGLEAQSTPRTWSFCSHAILRPHEVMEIPDASQDPRFAENPLVQGPLQLRFYAGAPLVTPEGIPFGALCVIDRAPRKLNTEQLQALQCLARQTTAQLELRLTVRMLKQQREKDALLRAEMQRALEALERSNKELVESRAAALRASQAKSDFLSIMSHEIRTPMNGVLGMNQLLSATNLSPEQRNYVQIVESSGRTLLALIDDLLDLAKIEAGKVTIESVDFDLRRLLTGIVDLWSTQASIKGLGFQSGIAAEIPSLLRGDPSRLRQVLNNLANNAIKFTARGEVSMHVELLSSKEDRAQQDRCVLRFSVADTGIGIQPDQASSLFSPFVQADVSTTRNYGGTGLGLAICKHLVELMGGTIGIESRVGEGSVFWFVLTLEVSQLSALPTELGAVVEAESRHSLRILVAEDNQINRLVVLTQLKKLGHHAVAVFDGAQAVASVSTGHYDLVLMDCEMPVMDGYEATRRIRQASRHRMPIIAVTAHAMSGDRERCLAAGMDDFISKPIDLQLLTRLLARWCPRPISQS